ncbi:uncharacterized protein MELLADRAFT_110599 [Melampsora larici-populina 98AG31]|uniref:Uncharacterized protein n=1 Tax=Melampsora larici-populina (strain 98AG31 / pathotype 3-4-7) TaxID=747676 RepID=F4S0C0_MELLP|nr:uncharacterized protein MELLADRAFT_110599 [Melampsora larici-populina 98AG31]EGG01963.1 hypothetical protein MELLADRAFT_110599 [Melampsora larici-populina 98AG31]
MPSALGKIFGRRGSNASNTSVNSVDSDESFQCRGIPDDFYDPMFDSEEEIARRARREELSRRAIYTGYEHVSRNVLPPPPNYYVLPPPLPKKVEIPEEMEILNSEDERLPHSAPAQTRRRAHTVGEESPSKSKSAPARRVKFSDTVEFSTDTPRSISPPDEDNTQSAPAHQTQFEGSNAENNNQDEGHGSGNAVSAPAHVTQFDDLTDSDDPDSQGSSSKPASLRKKLAHRHVRFHAGFDSRLAGNFPQFPIDKNEEVETISERALSTSRSESSLREGRFMFQKPRFLEMAKMKKK